MVGTIIRPVSSRFGPTMYDETNTQPEGSTLTDVIQARNELFEAIALSEQDVADGRIAPISETFEAIRAELN